MTIARFKEQRLDNGGEQRDLSSGMPLGYGLQDPSAIPPPGMNTMQRAGVFVSPHTMLQVDVVYTALRIISNNIIKMGNLRAFSLEFDANSGESYKKFLPQQPSILTNTFGGGSLGGQAGAMMQCTGMDRTVWSMALFGEAFWYIILRDELERPAAIEVLHPAFIEVKVKNGVLEYVYGTGQNKKVLELDNVVHIPLKSLPDDRRALAPVDYAGVAGALAMAAYEFGSSWFSQGASPGFILTTDQKLGQEEVRRIVDKFQIEHSGLQASHLPLVLDSGIKAEKIMASPDEAQYLQTLEYARQVIGAWFGIPPSKMPNALQRQPAAPPHTRQEEILSFQQDTLSGYIVPLAEAHSGLIANGLLAAFDEDQLSRPDAQFQAIKIQALRTTQAASINDVRVRELGWAPVPGGDDVIAPLASNTAPQQTEPNGPNDDNGPASGPESKSAGSAEARSKDGVSVRKKKSWH